MWFVGAAGSSTVKVVRSGGRKNNEMKGVCLLYFAPTHLLVPTVICVCLSVCNVARAQHCKGGARWRAKEQWREMWYDKY